MRIGIDARFYGKIGKGLGRYTQQLIYHLENIDTQNQYFIFLRKENFDDYQPKHKNFHKVLADVHWYGLKEQWKMPILLYKYRLDLVHFPHFNIPFFYFKSFVFTLHDLILLRFPTHEGSNLSPFLYKIKFFLYTSLLWISLKRARHIITVSEFTKNDILSHYRFLSGNAISVTYQANFISPNAPIGSKREVSSFLRLYGIIKPYFLYVGNAYPHKNLSRMIEAFLDLQTNEYCLVLVGKIDSFYKKLQEKYKLQEQEKSIFFLGELTDDELNLIYRGAFVYVFASLYEGFGLPPLEAMARGVPVLSSCAGSMPEILGRAPQYCDPMKKDSIACALRTMMDDVDIRKECKKNGLKQVRRYSWESLAKKTLVIYQQHKKP
jgi:glycosyltransferase involved in cell wall biosynthesis